METPKEIYMPEVAAYLQAKLHEKEDGDIKYVRADVAEYKWIDCHKQMPPETKYESDSIQGHHEWTESKQVLAWDSMYGPRIDATRNGKWRSEQKGGYQGQVCHSIIAWMPIPEYN